MAKRIPSEKRLINAVFGESRIKEVTGMITEQDKKELKQSWGKDWEKHISGKERAYEVDTELFNEDWKEMTDAGEVE
jgi:hypothetical protein